MSVVGSASRLPGDLFNIARAFFVATDADEGGNSKEFTELNFAPSKFIEPALRYPAQLKAAYRTARLFAIEG